MILSSDMWTSLKICEHSMNIYELIWTYMNYTSESESFGNIQKLQYIRHSQHKTSWSDTTLAKSKACCFFLCGRCQSWPGSWTTAGRYQVWPQVTRYSVCVFITCLLTCPLHRTCNVKCPLHRTCNVNPEEPHFIKPQKPGYIELC